MRPRGESISSFQLWYVGHAGRQKPQCTQSSISFLSGTLEAPDEAARIEAAIRIEVLLDALHDRERRRRRTPGLEGKAGRCGLQDQRPAPAHDLCSRIREERGSLLRGGACRESDPERGVPDEAQTERREKPIHVGQVGGQGRYL